MKFVADFHIHSKYSRATSRDMNLEVLDQWAKIKGINVLSCGDFTHPQWFKELKENLFESEPGLYKLKKIKSASTRFILTVEISCIYSKKGKVRKVHVLIFAPSFEVAEKINKQLGWRGNLRADGRPILGLDAKELTKIVLNISEQCLIVPAHIMTPWFGLFGSKSGFDYIEECFEEYSKYIYALETGLSADPPMLWRISDCREKTLLSNSDSHSPRKIGREANVFDTEISYSAIIKAIKRKNPKDFLYTIEFFPEEGKYHYDGHRLCGVSLNPLDSKKSGNICPACGKLLTIGVLNRVEQLADKPENFEPENAIPFKRLVPLEEIIAEALGVLSSSKQVEKEYKKMIEEFGSEFFVLTDIPLSDLSKNSLPEIVEGIKRVRENKIFIEPGYDGVYGKVRIFEEEKKNNFSKQKSLF